MKDVVRVRSQIEKADPTVADQLLPLAYDELRKLAAENLVNEKPEQSLQATDLDYDAYNRLVDVEKYRK